MEAMKQIEFYISDLAMCANSFDDPSWEGNPLNDATVIPCKRRGSNRFVAPEPVARRVLEYLEGCPANDPYGFGGEPGCREPQAVRRAIKQLKKALGE